MAKKRPEEEPEPEPEGEEVDEEGSEDESESADDNHTSPAASQALNSSDTSSGRSSPSASAFQLKPVTIKNPTAAASIDSEADTGEKKSAGIRGEEEEEVKKGAEGRWSESDEIALFNGMIQYKSERGSDPSSDMDAFLDYMEKSLQNKVSKSSLATKVRRLKQKYERLADNGEYPVFSKPHEQKLFELSEKIWGSECVRSEKCSKKRKSKSRNIGTPANQEPTSSLAPRAKKPKKVGPRVEEEKRLHEKYPSLFASMKGQSVDEPVRTAFMNVVGKIGQTKLKVWESMWNKLKRDELQLFVQQTSMIIEQAKEVRDVCRSG